MKICSFLPSGTEILFALGLGESVCGVTFECDYPAEARSKPVVVYSRLAPGLPEDEIDRQVKEFSSQGNSLYRLDADKLREIQPDVIVTQDLCHVCAASPNDLGAVLSSFVRMPRVLTLSPRTLDEVWNDIQTVGDACERSNEARRLVAKLRQQIADLPCDLAIAPRVLCLEWLDPPFVAGHWVPEMVKLAGGIDVLGPSGKFGYEVDWKTIVACDPDIILAMPCGYHRHEVEKELAAIAFPPEWHSMRAVRERKVFAMDGSSHFSRPGPRIVDGIFEMADLLARSTSTKEACGKSLAPCRWAASQRAEMKRILLSWSSGKDSAWTLNVLRQRSDYEIAGLLTTFNQAADRVAMHGVRRSLVEQQAAAAGLPLWSVPLPWPCSNEQYELLMSETCARAVAEGIEGVAFGDLFLEDVRAYRIRQMSGTGLEPLFPLWGKPTDILAREMVASGLKAILTCVDTRKLEREFAGRRFDEELLSSLPHGIDPCGENGEFHSFVCAGPMFRSEISFVPGETVVSDYFVFADLIPVDTGRAGVRAEAPRAYEIGGKQSPS